MPKDTAAIDHISNVIRRQFLEEMKDLTLFFVVYEPGKCTQALNAKRHEFYKHPAADTFFPYLRRQASKDFAETKFMGLCTGTEKGFIPLLSKQQTIAAFFLNSAHFDTPENTRQRLYRDIWPVLDLIEHRREKREDLYTEEDGVLQPVPDENTQAREDMLGDAFAAIMQELMGQKGTIPGLARERCLQTLQAVPGYEAEKHPYPIAADATQVVYDELGDEVMQKTRPVTLAMQMVREVGYTFDDASINQWQAFAQAAQEMAWMGFEKNKILGTAIYTSEDPYVRSMAYLVAEILNLEPGPVSDLDSHNPFTDQEVNQRLHLKRCEQVFSETDDNHSSFITAARKQNTKLLDGHIVGWCAHALLQAAKAWEDAQAEDLDQPSIARHNFQHGLETVDWFTLLRLNRLILDKKREGETITPEMLAELYAEDKSMTPVIQTLQAAPPESPAPDASEQESGQEKAAG